jgi:predicted dehydrogenase
LRTLGVGIIGSGSIARSAHIPAILRLPELVRLVAVSDVSEAAARETAAPYSVPWYKDYQEMLSRDDIDLVTICSPEKYHPEHTVDSANAGKHVLCEKPMAMTLTGCDAMMEACARNRVRLMIGHSRRFTGRYQEFSRAIKAGEIGEVRLVRENERRPYATSPGQWFPGHWSTLPESAMGTIVTNGIHETDLLRLFAGSPPQRVFAEHKTTRDGIFVADFITFTVTFENGAIGQAEISNCLPPGYPHYHQIEMYGTKGYLRSRDSDQQGLWQSTDTGVEFSGTTESLLYLQDSYTLEFSQFVLSILSGAPVPMAPAEAREAVKLGLAAHESATTGRAVILDSFERKVEIPCNP